MRKHIIRDRRDGYKLWRIAQMRRRSVNEVAAILVAAGLIHLELVEAVIKNEGKR